MARMARLVIPNYPHHVTQRGSRKQTTFFSTQDYLLYVDLLASAKEKARVDIWAYCLMPNHVHLVVTPESKEGICALLQNAHRIYARRINAREGWRGHLWQERFHSFVMDEKYLLATVRYTELNPVRAGLCEQPDDWRWSSVHAHMKGVDDQLVSVAPMLHRVQDWPKFLGSRDSDDGYDKIREHAKSGRPVGGSQFIQQLERLAGRKLGMRKRGPKIRN